MLYNPILIFRILFIQRYFFCRQLFSQLVMGFNGKNNLNIDRLTQMLEENRDLLNEMTQTEGSCSDGATLPKLLFELVEQAAKSGEVEPESDKSRSATPTPNTEGEVKAMGEDITDSVKLEPSVKKHRRRSAGGAGGAGVTAAVASLKSHEPEIMGKVATAEEIIGNLPKVWKVLMELLSHHKIERVQFEEQPTAAEDGHKAAPTTATTRAVVGGGATTTTTATTATTTTAATATGKAAELSVSKTYIKLKVSMKQMLPLLLLKCCGQSGLLAVASGLLMKCSQVPSLAQDRVCVGLGSGLAQSRSRSRSRTCPGLLQSFALFT